MEVAEEGRPGTARGVTDGINVRPGWEGCRRSPSNPVDGGIFGRYRRTV